MRHDMRQLTELLKAQNFDPTNFIEIGSRDGHDTAYLSAYWKLLPHNCYIIEAHPDCYNYIKQHYPQFNTLNIAASNKTEPITFNAGVVGREPNIGVSSVLSRARGEFISNIVEVDAWKMCDVMDHFKIPKFDFMKIDVEGFGLEVLQGFEGRIKNTAYIQIESEIDEVWANQSYHKDIVKYLAGFGFTLLDDIDLDDLQRDSLFKNKNNDIFCNTKL